MSTREQVAGLCRFLDEHNLGVPRVTRISDEHVRVRIPNVYLLRAGSTSIEPCSLVLQGALAHADPLEVLASHTRGCRLIRSGAGLDLVEVTAPDDWTTVPKTASCYERLVRERDERENDLVALCAALGDAALGVSNNQERYNLLLNAVQDGGAEREELAMLVRRLRQRLELTEQRLREHLQHESEDFARRARAVAARAANASQRQEALEEVAAAARVWLERWRHEDEGGREECMTREADWPAIEEALVTALDRLAKIEEDA